MVSTVGPGLRVPQGTIYPPAAYRWDLKDDAKFPQWKLDLLRFVRMATTATFFDSDRPTLSVIMERQEAARPSRRSMEVSLASAQEVLDQWDAFNAAAYNIAEGSVLLSEAQINEVNSRFGEAMDGLGLIAWIFAHNNSDKESSQLRYKARIDGLTIASTATATDVNIAFEVIETTWGKITDNSGKPLNDQINLALKLIPKEHYAYQVSSQLHSNDRMKIVPHNYRSFSEFRTTFIEMVDIMGLELGVTDQHTALAFSRDDRSGKFRKKRTDPAGSRSQCTTCPINCCEAPSKQCSVFGTLEISKCKGSKNQLSLIEACRDYVKESGVKRITADEMKDESSAIRTFITEWRKKRATFAKQQPAAASMLVAGSATPSDDDEPNFWDMVCADAGFFMVASLTDTIGNVASDESELNAAAAAFSPDTAAPAAASVELPIISSRPSSPPPKPPVFSPITGSGAPHAPQTQTAPQNARSAGIARAGALSPVDFPELIGERDAARRLSTVLIDQKDARSRTSESSYRPNTAEPRMHHLMATPVLDARRMQAMQLEIDTLQGNSYIAAARIEEEEIRGQELQSELARVQSVESSMRERLSTLSATLVEQTKQLQQGTVELQEHKVLLKAADSEVSALKSKAASTSERLNIISRLSKVKSTPQHVKSIKISMAVAGIVLLRLKAPRLSMQLFKACSKALSIITAIIASLYQPALQVVSAARTAVSSARACVSYYHSLCEPADEPIADLDSDVMPSALLCAPPPAVMPSAHSHPAVMMSAKHVRDAVLYDGGCSTLM